MDFLQHLSLLHWLGLGFILTLLELLIKRGYCFWLAIVAGLVGVLQWLIPGFIWYAQIITFAVLGLLVTFGWRSALRMGGKITRQGQDNFNIAKQYIGREFTLKKRLKKMRGKIHLDGRIWHIRVRGEKTKLPKGQKLKVVGHDGVVLICEVCSEVPA